MICIKAHLFLPALSDFHVWRTFNRCIHYGSCSFHFYNKASFLSRVPFFLH